MSKAELLADAYAEACFDQGLNQRTEDDEPEKRREIFVAELNRLSAINAELIEALRPLAAYPLEEFAMQGKEESRQLFGANDWKLLVGHVKAARAAIAKEQGAQS